MNKNVAFNATIINIFGNTFLFILKIWVALVSGSVALLSDAFNSLTDIVSSIAVYICVKISNREADEGHPFGHKRAEPIAGLIVAILAGILGFEMIRASVNRFYNYEEMTVTTVILLVPVITIIIKGLMAWYFKRVGRAVNSPAITASAVDSACDVAVSAAALVGIIGVKMGYPLFDPAAGIVISLWIIYTGYKIGLENIDYLMGKAPEDSLLRDIKLSAVNVPGVHGVNTVRAHYVGPFIHVEIHVELPRYLSIYDSHEISDEVEKRIESISSVERAFIHIDPV
ncbi:MAG: cation transporter [Deltaproteobacteria bacterium]|nr:cation transporter [Deltaproteobacteria bacterium]